LTVDALSVTDLGGSLKKTATHILYALAANDNDRFTYTVSDGHGGFATGTIEVKVIQAGGLVQSVNPGPSGAVTVNFAGIPGFQYDVERSSDPAGPWQEIATLTAPANGLFSHEDANPPAPAAYYRLTQNFAP
jgi:hypothetical protein